MGNLFSGGNAEPIRESESMTTPAPRRSREVVRVSRESFALPSAASADTVSESASSLPAAAEPGVMQGISRESAVQALSPERGTTAVQGLTAPRALRQALGGFVGGSIIYAAGGRAVASSETADLCSIENPAKPNCGLRCRCMEKAGHEGGHKCANGHTWGAESAGGAGSSAAVDATVLRAPAVRVDAGSLSPAKCSWDSSSQVYAHKQAILSLPRVDGLAVRSDLEDVLRTLRLYVALEAEEESLKSLLEDGVRSAFIARFGTPDFFQLQFEYHQPWTGRDLYAAPFLPCWVAPETEDGRAAFPGVVSCLLQFDDGPLQVLTNFHVVANFDLQLTGGDALKAGWPPEAQQPLWDYKCSKFSHLHSYFNSTPRPPRPQLRMTGVRSLTAAVPDLRWDVEHGCFSWNERLTGQRVLVDAAIGALQPGQDDVAAALLYEGGITDLQSRIRYFCGSGSVFTSPVYLLRAREPQLLPQRLVDYDYMSGGALGDGLLSFSSKDGRLPVTVEGDCGSLLVGLDRGSFLPLGYVVAGMTAGLHSKYGLAVPIIPCLQFAAEKLGAGSAARLRIYHSAAAALQHPLRAAAIVPRSRIPLGFDLHLVCEMPGRMHLLHEEPYRVALPDGAGDSNAWLRWPEFIQYGLLLAQRLLTDNADAEMLAVIVRGEVNSGQQLEALREAADSLKLPAWDEEQAWRARDFTIWLLEQDRGSRHFRDLQRAEVGDEQPRWVCADCLAAQAAAQR